MKNKIGVMVVSLLIGGLILSALPAIGKPNGGVGDKVKKLTERVVSLENAVKKSNKRINRLNNCFAAQGLGEVQVGGYGVLRLDNKNPKAYALTSTCSDDS